MQAYNFEVQDPERDVLELSVWDEDGECDDLVGTASLPLYFIPYDRMTGISLRMRVCACACKYACACCSEPRNQEQE